MPIRTLSEATSHVLTSTQTLNNAVSVIKELVDNALDARASSISIEIAANMLDKIIVKDDGSGIGVGDRLLLCKRGCTSKIANLDDLALLGGTSLGFRGTALASIAELSKEVTVITRVDGEQPATSLTFGPNGKLLSASSASHNAGTSVRIDGFLASVPVRRQIVLKNPSKILEEIKKLLQSYALARPAVKISLKVLKAKNSKGDWSFASSRGNDVLSTAAVQVIGKAVVDACKTCSQCSDDDTSKVEALLLKGGDNDGSKIGNVGQYFSIDGRPVSPEKDVMQDIIKKYKIFLQHACAPGTIIPSKPFIVMHIHCPASSYDVNVEPAKDVVLFHEPQKILALVEQLFTATYGELSPEKTTATTVSASVIQSRKVHPFDVLLARRKSNEDNNSNRTADSPASSIHKRTAAMSTLESDQTERSPPRSPETPIICREVPLGPLRRPTPVPPRYSPLPQSQRSYTMGDFDYDAEPPDFQSRTPAHMEEENEYNSTDITINNPFVKAKANAVSRAEQILHLGDRETPIGKSKETQIEDQQLSPPTALTTPGLTGSILPFLRPLPLTPETSPLSYRNPGPPFRRKQRNQNNAEGSENGTDLEQLELLSRRNEIRISPFETLVHPANRSTEQDDMSSDNTMTILPSSLTTDSVSKSANLQTQLRTSRTVYNPFRTPFKSPGLPGLTNVGEPSGKSSGDRPSIPSVDSPDRNFDNEDEDLRLILEFEKKKKHANKQMRHSLDAVGLARIQQGSLIAASSTSPQSEPLRILNPIKFASEVAEAIEAEEEEESRTPNTVRNATNPHQNRGLAAKNSLDCPQPLNWQAGHVNAPKSSAGKADHVRNSSASTSVAQLNPEPHFISALKLNGFKRSHSANTAPQLIAPDPRAYLISTRQNPTTGPSTANQLTKRMKSSRLPFETVPADVKKHNVLATPDTAFPPLNNLSSAVDALDQQDEYVRYGKIDRVEWRKVAGTKEVKRWQDTTKELVTKQYRGRIYRGSSAENTENADKTEISHGEDNSYEEVPALDETVSVIDAIQVRLNE